MLERLFWVLSASAYASAAALVLVNHSELGPIVFHWGLWALVVAGTVFAVLGNSLRGPARDAPLAAEHGANS